MLEPQRVGLAAASFSCRCKDPSVSRLAVSASYLCGPCGTNSPMLRLTSTSHAAVAYIGAGTVQKDVKQQAQALYCTQDRNNMLSLHLCVVFSPCSGGGECYAACWIGKGCGGVWDCKSKICSGGTCVEASTCHNGILDGVETGEWSRGSGSPRSFVWLSASCDALMTAQQRQAHMGSAVLRQTRGTMYCCQLLS